MIVPAQRLLWFAALAMAPLAAAAGLSIPLAMPCWSLFALCVLLAAVDAAAGLRRMARIQLRTVEALRLTKDVAGALGVSIDNGTGRAIALRLGVSMPAGMETEERTLPLRADSGSSLVSWPCTGRTRGDHRLDAIHVETSSPAGLWLIRARRDVDCLFRVYPNLRDQATAGLFLRIAGAGARGERQVGKGREFEHLRQYLPGDSFEDVHWKATAKRGYPAVKLYRVEHAQEVYALIDHSRLSAREGILESYVAAALHLALVAERQGDRFGLITFSDHTTRFVRARGGLDHFRVCREAIYNLSAARVSPDFREAFSSVQLNLRRRALLVFFTSLDDALLAESFERDVALLSRRHLVRVNAIRTAAMQPLFAGAPPADLDGVYSALAGQMLCNRMRTLQIALGNRGVKLALVDAANIKAQVAALYLDVKRRQAL
jgi:uncharacterized protein (DUF58 family)